MSKPTPMMRKARMSTAKIQACILINYFRVTNFMASVEWDEEYATQPESEEERDWGVYSSEEETCPWEGKAAEELAARYDELFALAERYAVELRAKVDVSNISDESYSLTFASLAATVSQVEILGRHLGELGCVGWSDECQAAWMEDMEALMISHHPQERAKLLAKLSRPTRRIAAPRGKNKKRVKVES